MDNAPNQFRTREFYATMLQVENMVQLDAPIKKQISVEFNFFVEYHGKSDCDRFFGMLARIYTDETSGQNASDIHTTKELFIRMFSNGIHERGGYVIDDQIDFSKLLSLDDEKVNVHTFELILSYITEENIATALSNRKTVVPTQITVKKVDAHDVTTLTLECSDHFRGRVYPHRLAGEFVWGHFYSFKVASI
jgi:hypothetical protein